MSTLKTISKALPPGSRLALAALALLLGACGGRVDDGPGDEGGGLEMEAPTEEGWLGFFRPKHSDLDFAPCKEDPALECATLEVPLDYKKSKCDSLDIAVARLPSTKKKPSRGVLVLGPGGPGGSGVDLLVAIRPFLEASPLREKFDIVSFDPRGVGRSHAIRCEVALPARPGDVGDDAQLAAYLDEFGERAAEACFKQNGPVVEHAGTNNVARDLDVLREALDEKQISFLGFSYGSELGAVYANLFPKRVRAMAFDGAMAPTFVDALAERSRDGADAAERALARLDRVCREDAGCPLQKAGVTATLEAVSAKLDAEPFQVAGQAPLTGDDVRFIAMGLLYSENVRWPLLVASLASASAGDFSILASLLPLARSSSVYTGGKKVALDAFTAVTCSDYGTRRPAAEVVDLARANADVYPHFGGPLFSLVHSAALAVAQCSHWPKADIPRIEDVSERVKTPLLIVGNDFDNATPIEWAQNLGKVLGMEKHVLRYQGGGHTAYGFGSGCVTAAVDAYLIDKKLPPPGATCDAEPVSFAFKAAADGSTRLIDLTDLAPVP